MTRWLSDIFTNSAIGLVGDKKNIEGAIPKVQKKWQKRDAEVLKKWQDEQEWYRKKDRELDYSSRREVIEQKALNATRLELEKLMKSDKSGLNHIKNKRAVTNELEKQQIKANAMDEIVPGTEDMTWRTFIAKQKTLLKMKTNEMYHKMGGTIAEANIDWEKELIKSGAYTADELKKYYKEKGHYPKLYDLEKELNTIELRIIKEFEGTSLDEIVKEGKKTESRLEAEDNYKANRLYKTFSGKKENMGIAMAQASERGDFLLDVTRIEGYEPKERDPAFFYIRTVASAPSSGSSIQKIGHYEQVITDLMQVDQSIWERLPSGGREQGSLTRILRRAMRGIFNESRQYKMTPDGQQIFTESESEYDYSYLFTDEGTPLWIKDEAKKILQEGSASSNKKPVINNKGLLTQIDVPVVSKEYLTGVYGKAVIDDMTNNNIDPHERHIRNVALTMALAPDDNVYRSVESILNSPDIETEMAKKINDPEWIINLRAVNALADVYFKPNSTEFKNVKLIKSMAQKEKAIENLNQVAFAEAWEAGQASGYINKTKNTMWVDPNVFYQIKMEMYASMFNVRNLLALTGASIETVEGDVRRFEGNPLGSMDKNSGVRKVDWNKMVDYVEKSFGGSLNDRVKIANEAIAFGDLADSSGMFLLSALDDLGMGGKAIIGGVDFINNLRQLGPELIQAVTGKTSDSNSRAFEDWVANTKVGGVSGSNLNDVYDRVIGTISAIVRDGAYTEKNARSIKKMLPGLQKALYTEYESIDAEGNLKIKKGSKQGGAIAQFKQGLSDLMSGRNLQSVAVKAARVKIAQVAFIFQVAAALQGEGGKAISDGDRKFVEDGASIGWITSVETRKAGIAQLMRITAKSNAINKALVRAVMTKSPGRLFAALTYGDSIMGVGGTVLGAKEESEFIDKIGENGLVQAKNQEANINESEEQPERKEESDYFTLGDGSTGIQITKGMSIDQIMKDPAWMASTDEEKKAIENFLLGGGQ
tara:strand:+ start:1934 stop:4903 length:2970 start_codon:yes stop_codon:yes gene_type:complete